MREFFPVIFSLVFLGIVSWAEIYLLKKLHRDWWSMKFVRWSARAVPFAGLAGIALWLAGMFMGYGEMHLLGAYLSSAALVVGLCLLLSLPVSGFAHWIAHAFGRTKEQRAHAAKQPELSDRRRFLKTASVIVPAVTLAGGGSGLANSFNAPLTPTIPLKYKNLPPALDGFRIAHITDVHLGLFIQQPQLEEIIELTSRLKPNMVLITGDFSDDAETYLDALRLAGTIPTTHGIYASIGNHEYFRGIKQIFRAYERGPIPLLRSSGMHIRVGDSGIWLAGADDPRSLGALSHDFFVDSLDKSLDGAPSEAFTLFMSHRPEGFKAAIERGVNLTVAGHTHGGQIAWNHRAAWDHLFGKEYMWGLYERNGSKLYTSSGAGHWFPFRLGCPAEIPLYILKRG